MTNSSAQLLNEINTLHDLLLRIDHPRAPELAQLATLHDADEAQFWKTLNSNSYWGGAGSLASETLMANPGVPESIWSAEIREFRSLLIAIGEHLVQRGDENPGIRSWLLAFNNWQNSEIV
jgi:hypothetical protein